MLRRLSIQSKIALVLLLVSIASLLMTAYLGYRSGQQALTEAVTHQLTGIRAAKSTMLENEFANIREQVVIFANSQGFINAMKGFREAFAELADRPMPPGADEAIAEFYRDVFIPGLKANVEGEPVAENYLPRLPAFRYLQYHYIVKNPEPYFEKGKMMGAEGDDSPYGDLHRAIHPVFDNIIKRLGFEDAMLVDSETGDLIYSHQKTVEFATNLADGPFADTGIGDLHRVIRRGMDRGAYKFSDFEKYRPNLAMPSAFVISPIFDGTKMIGALIFQFPVARINRITTGNYGWEREGLGRSGETYLIGSDYLLRSQSRFAHEDFPAFVKALRDAGKPPRMVDRIERSGTLLLNLEVRSEAAVAAIGGKEGLLLDQRDYRDVSTISSYAPLDLEDVRWGIMSEIDRDEALAPIRAFANDLLKYAVAAVLGVTILSILLARWLVKPLQKLSRGARRVGAGDVDVQVDVRSDDEFGELAASFNGMVRSLKAKTEEIERQSRERDELLRSILPGPVAARMRDGYEQISDTYADITVLFADILGFTELSESLPAEKAIGLLNDLVVAFDETAEKYGVEKVRTFGSSYMAVCGLSIQRPDHTNRVVEFARELQRVIRRFNQERETELGLEIGINAGPVVGGVVGRSKFLYDLWGDTVNLARKVSDAVGADGDGTNRAVRVSDAVYQRVKDYHTFEPCGEVTMPGKGAELVWSVKA